MAAALVATATALLATAPVAGAAVDQFCTELDASWDGSRCTTVITSPGAATRLISFALPGQLLEDPTSGPALRNYYHRLMDGWRTSGGTSPRDSSATADHQIFSGPGSVQSVIVHENLSPFGIQANNAYRSFVFDMAQGRRLTLADLFRPGIDPMIVIPPATEAVLPAALNAAAPLHAPNTYPFTVAEWTPGPHGPGYTGSYRTFALTPDHLRLYLPDAPMLREVPSPRDRLMWSMDGGTVTLDVPLSALADTLRPEYGGV